MDISVVIRAFNEKDRLAELLDVLDRQELDGRKEVIVVDNDSADGTQAMVRDRGAELLNISRDEFSYPRSMNMGVRAANYELVVLTVGHALPTRRDWLARGARHFSDPKVAGVFSPVLARKGSPLAEKIFYGSGYLAARLMGSVEIGQPGVGIMGATNCMFRKSLWQEHPFDERYELGGEDGEWALWAMSAGYKIIRDPAFVVRHSHGNGWKELVRQREYWGRLGVPTKFDRSALRFRKDIRW